MEALSLPINTLTNSNANNKFSSLSATSSYASLSSLKFSSCLTTRTLTLKSVVRVQAENEDYELKQMRDMAAARKRWEALIREGKVKVLTPREAGYAVQLSNKPLLDVRPSNEHNKAWVRGSTWIPIFDVDSGLDVGTIPRKITNFVMGGWWSGMPTLSYDSQFLAKVQEKFPKDTELIIACQKGLSSFVVGLIKLVLKDETNSNSLIISLLENYTTHSLRSSEPHFLARSLAACELLYNAGYKNLFWVQGGLEAAEDEDLIVEGPVPLKFAGIGGVSEFLGWTDQQRAAAAKEGWGYRLVFSARLIGVFLAADALYIGAQQIGRYLQDIRTH